MKTKMSIYEIITDRIIQLVEDNPGSWMKPWNGGQAMAPRNGVSKKMYRGSNLFMTFMISGIYGSPFFLTYNQAKSLGGQVKKGEKGFPVVFWNRRPSGLSLPSRADRPGFKEPATQVTPNDPVFNTGDAQLPESNSGKPFIRYYTVFNSEQCEGTGIEKPETKKQIDFHPIRNCEAVLHGFQKAPEIQHKSQQAYYSPAKDLINMPLADTFGSSEKYYSTLFHEMGHSTGHESRLNREGITNTHFFGDTDYSKEELIAEMSACFLCGHTGIGNDVIKNSASYLDGWLKKLKAEPKMLISAGQQAQKAVDLILGVSITEEVNV